VIRPTAIAAGIALLMASCGGGTSTVEGIVVEVNGDLSAVADFTIVTSESGRLRLVPALDLRFADGTPLSHLGEHIRSGDPVAVTYEELADGTLSATRVDDA
jgi:hypothetical protein